MEVCEGKLYLENLEEEILQRNNIVTYKWLMKTAKVTSNVAKQMLYEFVEKQRENGTDLHVTYLVAGQRTGDNTMVHEVCIIPASQLESTKAKFSLVTSVHVYGVHKSPIQDHNVLYSTDYYLNGNAMEDIKKSCAIYFEAVTFRVTNGVEDSPLAVQKSPSVSSPEEQIQTSSSKHRTSLPKSKISHFKKGSIEGALMNMFKGMEKKKKTDSLNYSANTLHTIIKQESEREREISSVREDARQPTLAILNISNDKSAPECPKNSIRKVEKVMAKKDKKCKNKTVNNIISKKRKRIIEISESSSEDEESHSPVPSPPPHPADVHSDDSEEPLPQKMLEPKGTVKGVRKKRKLIEKTTRDDEYLVTEKVWVEVDASEDDSAEENEDPLPPPKSVSPAPKCTKTIAPPMPATKNKQATLMNFFKRK